MLTSFHNMVHGSPVLSVCMPFSISSLFILPVDSNVLYSHDVEFRFKISSKFIQMGSKCISSATKSSWSFLVIPFHSYPLFTTYIWIARSMHEYFICLVLGAPLILLTSILPSITLVLIHTLGYDQTMKVCFFFNFFFKKYVRFSINCLSISNSFHLVLVTFQ